jgi:hypothetical protein
VSSALQAVQLLCGARRQGLATLTAGQVVVDVDVPEIPVGIDGETVMMPAPVRCTIRPKALRVRVPRDRPGIRPVGLPLTGRRCGSWHPSALLAGRPPTPVPSLRPRDPALAGQRLETASF